MIWFWVALVLALNVGFVLGAWWNSRPREWTDKDVEWVYGKGDE